MPAGKGYKKLRVKHINDPDSYRDRNPHRNKCWFTADNHARRHYV